MSDASKQWEPRKCAARYGSQRPRMIMHLCAPLQSGSCQWPHPARSVPGPTIARQLREHVRSRQPPAAPIYSQRVRENSTLFTARASLTGRGFTGWAACARRGEVCMLGCCSSAERRTTV